MGKTALGNRLCWWLLSPVGFADEDDAACAKALRQQLDCASRTSSDPGGTEAGCHTDLFIRDITGRIAVNEGDTITHVELDGATCGVLRKQGTHIDPGSADGVVARPRTQHLPGTAAEVQYPRLRFQP